MKVPVTVASGLSEDEIRELRIADNKTNESAWNDFLQEDIKELSFDGFDFGFNAEDAGGGTEDRYTTKTQIPQYEITGESPVIGQLYDKTKAEELICEIEQADIPNDVKDFLNLAAGRHVVFNYREIAEYYVNAPKEIQQLMEKSALVIIDLDDAIANGYAKLHESIAEMLDEDAKAV